MLSRFSSAIEHHCELRGILPLLQQWCYCTYMVHKRHPCTTAPNSTASSSFLWKHQAFFWEQQHRLSQSNCPPKFQQQHGAVYPDEDTLYSAPAKLLIQGLKKVECQCLKSSSMVLVLINTAPLSCPEL